MQNHFICCSYISEKELFSIADYLSTKIIYGFDNFENGSLLTMSNGDIDTTGKEVSGAYNGAKNVESYNKNIKYFVPSELTKASITKGYGYNEVVLERRDESTTGENIAKRKPSYIIMPVSSIDGNTFTLPEELYQNQLSFISPEDRQEITNIIHTEKYGVDKKVAQVLVKYKEIIKQHAIAKNVPLKELAYSYVDLIIKSYNYEECLKASSEFNIPLVVIDREYYFKRMLADSSNYSDEMKPRILNLFLNINESKKQKLYGLIQKGDDVSNLLPPIPSQEQTLAD
jgi:hypothetical protein